LELPRQRNALRHVLPLERRLVTAFGPIDESHQHQPEHEELEERREHCCLGVGWEDKDREPLCIRRCRAPGDLGGRRLWDVYAKATDKPHEGVVTRASNRTRHRVMTPRCAR